ncbi:lysophospholipid acyltransferase family protein [Phocaeicola barnesiae]|uniref:lysophospholipid acyltransferase family protein n=1 Tax=Phocaeicola barnesiae TaxID=376804 RepID=UPI001F462DAD|nr:lysophospholipid acyltransferase family protein [Phocaeicola barnesiae]MCF2575437.1 lysophospholipid acyltransferase family protein [Phocaeicola barnesiae]MDM8232070.1 lysophospholipid acyltransferase family protein [Phocaeicola barnesiae]MDM8241830.1 lysophospholipid acyltransferase family protein [Phocaeicola barnesiae]MDM8256814.1 lysophospholipid acyltransferase family protein [Phocaeicola barnesiae]MDM8308495.1 lysophospholipid acyltransferase family protein [Phocaeicola barnesiae]
MKFVYHILFFLLYLLSLLPMRLLYLLSDCLFFPLFHIVKYRRKVVEKQLDECFPEKSMQERRAIERQFYHFFCDYLVEVIKLFSISKKEMMRRMKFVGIEQVREELKDKKFCFLYLGHYCNWEYIASLSYWLPEIHCGQIYHRIYNQAFDELFLKLRGQFGGESILMKDTLRRILTLRNQEKKVMIGFIADQLPKWENMHHWTTFLNHDTSFFIGAERIAKQVDAALYYVDVERVKRGYYQVRFRLMTLHPKEFPDYELTDQYARLLEESICRQPAYWLWTHKRWKRTKEEWLKRQQEVV